MNSSANSQQKITLAIQAAISVIVLFFSVRGAARVQTAAAKKMAKKDARQMGKLRRQEYKLRSKLMKQKYRTKLRNAKSSGRRAS